MVNSTDYAGLKSFEVFIDVTAYVPVKVRVQAFNDRGESPPSWYAHIISSSPWVNSYITVADYTTGTKLAQPVCYVGLDECTEGDANSWIIPRGLPGKPDLFVPLYPEVDVVNAFGSEWALIYFTVPSVNGDGVDKWRVEWGTDASFSNSELVSFIVTENMYYNITDLSMGEEYYIRVIAHHTGGYGAPSNSYSVKPHRQPDPVYNPTLQVSNDATSLEDYARTLTVGWSHPTIDTTDKLGNGGDPISSYLI